MSLGMECLENEDEPRRRRLTRIMGKRREATGAAPSEILAGRQGGETVAHDKGLQGPRPV